MLRVQEMKNKEIKQLFMLGKTSFLFM